MLTTCHKSKKQLSPRLSHVEHLLHVLIRNTSLKSGDLRHLQAIASGTEPFQSWRPPLKWVRGVGSIMNTAIMEIEWLPGQVECCPDQLLTEAVSPEKRIALTSQAKVRE
ncbi:hypothetical protein Pelo_1819 [Pelomyxa schiedti]|nr:hypothetical protein Pelo_1819 [Pelomyxa schiedti]